MPQESRRLKYFTLGAMCFSLFMVMLDNTVVNLALPTIARQLGSSISGLQWILDAFILLLASLMLTGGTLGDLYGRRRAFMAGLVVFTGGSLFCALSPNIGSLIAARAIQGVGAAIMMPNTLAIITYTFRDPRERAQAIGIWAGVSGIALALGPALGGVMVDAWGWQSIFYLNVPIGVVAVTIALLVVPESKNPEGRGLDLTGQALAVVGLGALTYALIEANNYGWRSGRIVALLVVGVAMLAAFGLWESRAESPMLRLTFFRNITFTGANLVGLIISFGFFGMLFFLALFMQNVQGYSATGAGIRQLPTTIAVMVFAILSGRIAGRIGARIPITIGMFLVGAGLLAFTMVQAITPYSHFWFILAVLGAGTGLVMSPMTSAAMGTVPAARAGMASATLNTTRQVGGVFGIAVLGAIVTDVFGSHLVSALTALHLPPQAVTQIAAAAQNSQERGAIPNIPGVDPSAISAAIGNSFTSGLRMAFWVGGPVLLIGSVVAAIMIRHTTPAAQLAQRAAREALGAPGIADAEAAAAGAAISAATDLEAVMPAKEAQPEASA
jgi:EmrB/QacA subfamily drug resistance transporter